MVVIGTSKKLLFKIFNQEAQEKTLENKSVVQKMNYN